MKRYILIPLILICTAVVAQEQDFYTHPDWAKNAVIYEVNVRQYTPEGTFKAFEESLPRLKEMGVDILWIMPIYPIGEVNRKGTLGSYYAVKDYQKVNPEFGNMNDFKELVTKAHSMGFKVILDWVADHSSPDNYLTKEHPDWYKHDSITHQIIPPVADWTDVAAFDYSNKALWSYQIESMKYWIKNADVDGFRCDVAMMVPLEFWRRVRTSLDSVKKVFMLAEAEGPEFNRNGFDMTYGWNLLNLMNKTAKGKKDAGDYETYMYKIRTTYKPDDYHMYFTSNHDENSWNGTEYERMGAGVKCFDVLCFTLPGMPLIYSGQESALNRRLRFFDKDTIEWKDYPMQKFYHSLIQLKKENKVLWNGDEGGGFGSVQCSDAHILAYTRFGQNNIQQILVILNLSGVAREIQLTSPFMIGKFKEVFNHDEVDMNGQYSAHLPAWGYRIFIKK